MSLKYNSSPEENRHDQFNGGLGGVPHHHHENSSSSSHSNIPSSKDRSLKNHTITYSMQRNSVRVQCTIEIEAKYLKYYKLFWYVMKEGAVFGYGERKKKIEVFASKFDTEKMLIVDRRSKIELKKTKNVRFDVLQSRRRKNLEKIKVLFERRKKRRNAVIITVAEEEIKENLKEAVQSSSTKSTKIKEEEVLRGKEKKKWRKLLRYGCGSSYIYDREKEMKKRKKKKAALLKIIKKGRKIKGPVKKKELKVQSRKREVKVMDIKSYRIGRKDRIERRKEIKSLFDARRLERVRKKEEGRRNWENRIVNEKKREIHENFHEAIRIRKEEKKKGDERAELVRTQEKKKRIRKERKRDLEENRRKYKEHLRNKQIERENNEEELRILEKTKETKLVDCDKGGREGKFQVFLDFKIRNGRFHPLDVDPYWTIEELKKEAIVKMEIFSGRSLFLISKGKCLDDWKVVKDCVLKGDTLRVRFRGRGSGTIDKEGKGPKKRTKTEIKMIERAVIINMMSYMDVKTCFRFSITCKLCTDILRSRFQGIIGLDPKVFKHFSVLDFCKEKFLVLKLLPTTTNYWIEKVEFDGEISFHGQNLPCFRITVHFDYDEVRILRKTYNFGEDISFEMRFVYKSFVELKALGSRKWNMSKRIQREAKLRSPFDFVNITKGELFTNNFLFNFNPEEFNDGGFLKKFFFRVGSGSLPKVYFLGKRVLSENGIQLKEKYFNECDLPSGKERKEEINEKSKNENEVDEDFQDDINFSTVSANEEIIEISEDFRPTEEKFSEEGEDLEEYMNGENSEREEIEKREKRSIQGSSEGIIENSKLGRKKAPAITRDMLNFKGIKRSDEFRNQKRKVERRMKKYIKKFQETLKAISSESNDITWNIKFSPVEEPRIQASLSMRNGVIVESKIVSDNLKIDYDEEIGSVEEELIRKERYGHTSTSVKMRLQEKGENGKKLWNSMDRKRKIWQKNQSKGLFQYVLESKHGKKNEAFGLIKCPTAIIHEDFHDDEYVVEFLEDLCEYQYHGKLRQEYLDIDLSSSIFVRNENNTSFIVCDVVKLIIADEAKSRDGKVCFDAGYIRDLLTRHGLKRKSLRPFKFASRAMTFFERVKCMSMGYKDIIDFCENYVFKFDLSHLYEEILPILVQYCVINFEFFLKANIKIVLKYNYKDLDDLKEQKDTCLSTLSPQIKVTNKLRHVGIFKNPPESYENELEDFEKMDCSLMYQYQCLFKGSYLNKLHKGEIPFIFDDESLKSENSIHKRSGRKFRMDRLHLFGGKWAIDFFTHLQKFVPFVLFKAYGEEWKIHYIRFLRFLVDNGLLMNGFDVQGTDVFFHGRLAFFNQTINLKFYETLGFPNSKVNVKLRGIILLIVREKDRNLCLYFQSQFEEHFCDMAKLQHRVYSFDWMHDTIFRKIWGYIDWGNARRDSFQCHMTNSCSHYRRNEGQIECRQLIEIGRGGADDIGNVEENHRSTKRKIVYQYGYSTSGWEDHDIMDIKTGQQTKILPELKGYHSLFFFYENIHCREKVIFPEYPKDLIPKLKFKFFKCDDKKWKSKNKIPMKDDKAVEDVKMKVKGKEEKEPVVDKELLLTMEKMKNRKLEFPPKGDKDHDYFVRLESFRIEFEKKVKELVEEMNDCNLNVSYSNLKLRVGLEQIQKFSLEHFVFCDNIRSIFYDNQPPIVEKIMNDFIKANKPLLCVGECGFGKTFVMIFCIVVLIANSFCKNFIIISRTNIINQWLGEFKLVCEKCVVSEPTYYFVHKAGKKCTRVIADFMKRGGILFSTFQSMKKFETEELELLKKKKVFLIADESQIIKNESSKYMKQLMKVSQLPDVRLNKIFLTGTPFNETIKGSKAQMKVLFGLKDVPKEISHFRDRNPNHVMEFVNSKPYGDHILRVRVNYGVELNYSLVFVPLSPVMDKLNDIYHEKILNGRSRTIDPNIKFLSSTSCHRIIDECVNSGELIYQNYRTDKNYQYFKELLENSKGEFQYLRKDLNQKSYLARDFSVETLRRGLKGVVIVNSFIFQCSLRRALEYLSKYDEILQGNLYWIHGSTSILNIKDRQTEIDKFKGSSRGILFGTSKLLEYGINLQCSNKMLILTMPREMTSFVQLPYRQYRKGQVRDVDCIQICFDETFEHHLLNRFIITRLPGHHKMADGLEIPSNDIYEKIESCKNKTSGIEFIDECIKDHNVVKVVDFRKEILGYQNLEELNQLITRNNELRDPNNN